MKESTAPLYCIPFITHPIDHVCVSVVVDDSMHEFQVVPDMTGMKVHFHALCETDELEMDGQYDPLLFNKINYKVPHRVTLYKDLFQSKNCLLYTSPSPRD